ncbi:hypothetical protein [Brevundimonas sp.]|uniref:hypothetical protein n=1 Tax=Brevundimonas sp. TaxID=1871086 RepID=UPI0025C3FBF7|nr:hypothetical protein [Brevundimonas sp.]
MGDAAPGLSAATQIMSGRAQAKALKTEGVMLEAQAKGVDLQALQSSERRREELNANMAAFMASRAARGLSLDSPSGIAIEKELARQAVRDENVERVGFTNQSGALRMSAKAKRRAGSTANIMGYVGAGTTLADGVSNAVSAGLGGSKAPNRALPNSAFKW